MTPKRILHCIPGMGGGGAERQLAYLARGLIQLGWDVHIALVSEGPNFERLRASGAVLHRLRARSNYDPRILAQLLATVERIRPDLIQVWVLQMEVIGALAARLKGVPWIMSERCSEPAYPASLKHRLRARIGAGTAAVVSNSEGGDRYWSARLASRVPRFVIPNALPLEEIDGMPPAGPGETLLESDHELILFAGRLTHQKNPDGLMRALVPVISERRRVRAVIAGEGPMAGTLRDMAREYHIEDRVRFPGFLENIWGWMKRASVFASPTRFEGHPNAVIEAMACGCPLVVSDIPPHRDFLDERSALLVPPDDPERLSTAIVEALQDPRAAAERAAVAATLVRSWTVTRMAAEYDRVYKEVLRGAPRRQGAVPQ